MSENKDVLLFVTIEEGLKEEPEMDVEKNDKCKTIITKDYKNNVQTTVMEIRCTPVTINARHLPEDD